MKYLPKKLLKDCKKEKSTTSQFDWWIKQIFGWSCEDCANKTSQLFGEKHLYIKKLGDCLVFCFVKFICFLSSRHRKKLVGRNECFRQLSFLRPMHLQMLKVLHKTIFVRQQPLFLACLLQLLCVCRLLHL